MGARDYQVAFKAAHLGIEALGTRYRPRRVKDDTTLKIAAAEEQLAAGRAEEAARSLGESLRLRIDLYLRRYPDVQ